MLTRLISPPLLVIFLAGLLLFPPASLAIEFGVRPQYLVEQMQDSALKTKLQNCRPDGAKPSRFSIAHRGAPLQFPEHTLESYRAAVLMGAGMVECDVAFTKDRQLVCRHAQCDLHATTDILLRPDLAQHCQQGFQGADSKTGAGASARCCTSDISLEQFRSLCGLMDGVNPDAANVEEYLQGTPGWRTELYASCGTMMSHRDSIALIDAAGLQFVPELKSPEVTMPFNGTYSQADYASQLVDEYLAAGVDPERVWLQSFNQEDVFFWIEHYPKFARQVVYLDDRPFRIEGFKPSADDFKALYRKGLRHIAPPIPVLIKESENGLQLTAYAKLARDAGLELITWSLERSGPLDSGGGWYFQSMANEARRTGDGLIFPLLEILAEEAGVIGVFSDWPATTSYYAHCTGR